MFDKNKYSTITLNGEDGKEREVYVLCQTSLNGDDYIVVSDDEPEKDEVEVTILKLNKEGSTEEDLQYDVVDDKDEASALLEVFGQIMETQESEEGPDDGKWT